jgi:hypothetical protein
MLPSFVSVIVIGLLLVSFPLCVSFVAVHRGAMTTIRSLDVQIGHGPSTFPIWKSNGIRIDGRKGREVLLLKGMAMEAKRRRRDYEEDFGDDPFGGVEEDDIVYYDDDENVDDEGRGRGRSLGRRGNNRGFDGDEESSSSDNNGSIMGSVRKLYDALFFYGLEVPDTDSSRRRRGGGGNGNVAGLRKSPKTKNPFFTGSERAAEAYFNAIDGKGRGKGGSNSNGDQDGDQGWGREGKGDPFALGMDAVEEARDSSSSSSKRRGRRRRRDEVQGALASYDSGFHTEEGEEDDDAGDNDNVEGMSIEYVERRLGEAEESLLRVDSTITEIRNRLASGAQPSARARRELQGLEATRAELLGAIENLKIRAIDIEAN